jgi:hypothetical protein
VDVPLNSARHLDNRGCDDSARRIEASQRLKSTAASTNWIAIGGGFESKARGVQFCVSPDAHAIDEFENVIWGMSVARRAGLESSDVVKIRSLSAIKSFPRLPVHPVSNASYLAMLAYGGCLSHNSLSAADDLPDRS